MPFQTAVNLQPAPGLPGDFASADPRASVLAGPGALVAGSAGLTCGLFAWLDITQTQASNTGTGAPAGFVHRGSNIGLITIYLAETSSLVPAGFEVTLHRAGDFWARTTTTATANQKVFANNTDGSISTGAMGATIAGSTETKWYVGSAGAVGELIKITSMAQG